MYGDPSIGLLGHIKTNEGIWGLRVGNRSTGAWSSRSFRRVAVAGLAAGLVLKFKREEVQINKSCRKSHLNLLKFMIKILEFGDK